MKVDDDKLKALEPMRVIILSDVAKLLGVTVRTLIKIHGDKIVRISPRRRGMRVRDIMRIGETEEQKG